ncbi:DUF3553 domain-containing protein [Geomonas oryzae]|uniref:DUF3553 domain-containing protein n=1 Tax=Geomonas oryzae TaxID=2364273 RepID=UPI0018E07A13|nr:DUF3553 domain-containing protein [Geomonas oryzae]
MNVKRGSVVSHAMAQQWGTGKVVEVNDYMATIRFSDGMVRKIISSHFTDLRPADPATYTPPAKTTKGRGKGTRVRSTTTSVKAKAKAKAKKPVATPAAPQPGA